MPLKANQPQKAPVWSRTDLQVNVVAVSPHSEGEKTSKPCSLKGFHDGHNECIMQYFSRDWEQS